MSILTLDVGGSNISVLCQRGGHAPPRQVGTIQTAHGGTRTSSIRVEPMVVPVILTNSTPSQTAAIRTLFALGAQVSCQGDVFNNGNAVIVCSGILSDEFEPPGPWFVPTLTLYEITSASYSPILTRLYLTNVDSVDDPGDHSILLGSTDIADDANGNGTEVLMDTTTIPTCGGAPDPAVTCALAYGPLERTWLSVGSPNGGQMVGVVSISFGSSGGTGDHWATQDCMCKIFVVRGGVDVVEWDTAWSGGNGGLGGGDVACIGPAVNYGIQVGDQIRIELYGRAARHGGYNTSDYQTVGFGELFGNHLAHISYGGGALFE